MLRTPCRIVAAKNNSMAGVSKTVGHECRKNAAIPIACERGTMSSAQPEAEKYRSYADKCEQEAARADNTRDRERWFDLAEFWLAMANRRVRAS
jgi:hypothetical protein